MSRDDRTILLNSELLALYLRVSQVAGSPDGDAAIAELLALRDTFDPGDDPGLGLVFDRFAALVRLHLGDEHRSRLDAALAKGRDLPGKATKNPAAFEGQLRSLGPIRAKGQPGISLVTCAMNRSQNLIQALPSWLANAEISEVLVVDWSSTPPVAQDLQAAGIADPRIRILRIEGEENWVLSYAFNAGFRAAACNHILKADADIVLSRDFFQRNRLAPDTFFAGNWRNAKADQAHVNGFFYASRAALHAVGGFNEHITSYGWDDDDIYDRLTGAGYRRQDVAADTIFHLDHDDAERIGDTGVSGHQVTLREDLISGTAFLIRRNRYIAMVMPQWDAKSIPLPFRVISRSGSDLKIRRHGWLPSRVPPHVVVAANAHARAELASWRFGKRVLDLTPERLERLLDLPVRDVSAIDVEIAVAAPDHRDSGIGRYLVLDIAVGVLDATTSAPRLETAFSWLLAAARARGLRPVLRAPFVELPAQAPACLRLAPLIPTWEPVGEVRQITLNALAMGNLPQGENLQIGLTAHTIERAALAAPAVALNRPRFYIDVQHGLGNRLRALASAAAIAAAADRELVAVWEPDAHCDCRLSDLFDYAGAVEESRFVEQAGARGCVVYNYMPNEPGAQKGAPILLDRAADIYARSAFVLNSPASTWATENRFLQSLIPVPQIRALVDQVRNPNGVSAHVRMEGGRKSEHLAYERADNWTAQDHALIDEWRSKSHFSHFLTRIDALMAQGRADSIFLAADMPETYEVFRQHYGDRLACLPRDLFDRSARQLHFALADAILLSRSPLLLGSGWSSFSELAIRLAPKKIAIELSGKDF